MTEILDRVAALAPTTPVDPDGLTAARALLAARLDEPLSPSVVPLRAARRRAGRVALTGAAAVLVAGVAFVVTTFAPQPDPAPGPSRGLVAPGVLPPLPAAAAEDDECLAYLLGDPLLHETVVTDPDDLATTPGADQVASWLPGFTPDSVRVTTTHSPCGQTEPAAVFHDPTGAGGVSLYPAVADPWPGLRAPDDVAVRGVTGRTLSPEAGHHFVTWVEPDGVRWFVVGNGMDVPALVAWLDTLPLSGQTVGPDATYPGMQRVADLPPVIDGPSDVVTWSLMLPGPGETDADDDGLSDVQPGISQLTVTLGEADPMEAAFSWAVPGRVLTQVHGHPARFSSGHEGFSILTWADEGRVYQLWGAATVEDAVRVAETVQPVALDDPRVLAALG